MLHVQVGKVYLAGPPEGHKVALPGAAVSAYSQLKYQGWKYLIGRLICMILHEWPASLAPLNTKTLQARRQLEQHCQTLESTEGNSVQADLGLLRKAAFEFVWQKLEEKHDAWRTARAQPTRLQALLCALLWVLLHCHLLKKVKVDNKDVSPRFPETPDMLDDLKMAAIVSLNGTTIVKYAQNALGIHLRRKRFIVQSCKEKDS